MTVQQFGYYRLIVSGLNKGVNLICLNLDEVFLGRGQLRMAGQKDLNAKHPNPPNHQFNKVALRALIYQIF